MKVARTLTQSVLNATRDLYRPEPYLLLLQKVVVADPDTARRAWQEWVAFDRLDDVSWREQKLLAAAYTRIEALDPGYRHLMRLKGMMKSDWVFCKIGVVGAQTGLRRLADADIPFLVFKGSGYLPQDRFDGVRLSADIDILVQQDQFARSIALLLADGWKVSQPGFRPDDVESHEALNLKHPERNGRLDVHRQACNHFASPAFDAGVWRRSSAAKLLGVDARRCSLADHIAIIIAEGGGDSHITEQSALWAVDLIAAIHEMEPADVDALWQVLDELDLRFAYLAVMNHCINVLKSPDIRRFFERHGAPDLGLRQAVSELFSGPMGHRRGTKVGRIGRWLREIRQLTSRQAA